MADGRYINDGKLNSKTGATNGVWAVRGAGGGMVKLAATGYYDEPGQVVAGDDGSVLAGVGLTYPRFVDNGNGTVTDTVTGLVWLKAGELSCGQLGGSAGGGAVAGERAVRADGWLGGGGVENAEPERDAESRRPDGEQRGGLFQRDVCVEAERGAVSVADFHEFCGERVLLDVDDGCRGYERGVGGIQLRLRCLRPGQGERGFTLAVR